MKQSHPSHKDQKSSRKQNAVRAIAFTTAASVAISSTPALPQDFLKKLPNLDSLAQNATKQPPMLAQAEPTKGQVGYSGIKQEKTTLPVIYEGSREVSTNLFDVSSFFAKITGIRVGPNGTDLSAWCSSVQVNLLAPNAFLVALDMSELLANKDNKGKNWQIQWPATVDLKIGGLTIRNLPIEKFKEFKKDCFVFVLPFTQELSSIRIEPLKKKITFSLDALPAPSNEPVLATLKTDKNSMCCMGSLKIFADKTTDITKGQKKNRIKAINGYVLIDPAQDKSWMSTQVFGQIYGLGFSPSSSNNYMMNDSLQVCLDFNTPPNNATIMVANFASFQEKGKTFVRVNNFPSSPNGPPLVGTVGADYLKLVSLTINRLNNTITITQPASPTVSSASF